MLTELENYLGTMRKKAPHPDKKMKLSPLYDDICRLVKITEKTLEKEEPPIRAWLWKERKVQIEILKLSLANVHAHPFLDDTPLFLDCFFVLTHSQKGFFYSIYNYFHERLDYIINTLDPNQMNRSTSDTVNYLIETLSHQQSEESENRELVERTKNTLASSFSVKQSKEKIEAQLAKISIEGISGEELLKGLVILVRKEAAGQIRETIDELRKLLVEQTTNSFSMEVTFAVTLEEMRNLFFMLQEFRKSHPQEFDKLNAEFKFPVDRMERRFKKLRVESPVGLFPKDRQQKIFQTTPVTSAQDLLKVHGFLTKSASCGDLSYYKGEDIQSDFVNA